MIVRRRVVGRVGPVGRQFAGRRLRSAGLAVAAAGIATLLVAGCSPDDAATTPDRTAPKTSRPATSSAVPAPSTAAPAVPHERVPAARPVAFSVTGPAFTIRARVCSMAPIVPLDPPGNQHDTVCWINGRFGVAPGSQSGTSFILGHAWAPDPDEVLNKLSARATRQLLAARPRTVDGVQVRPVTNLDGYRVALRTKHGTLRYVVRSAYGVAKADLPMLRSTWHAATKRRVVIITCAQRAGRDYDYNVVVEAYLTSSQRSSNAGHRAAGHRAAGHRAAGYRAAGHRGVGHRAAGRRRAPGR